MRIYLAARYSRREELLGYAKILEGLGHKITSTWIDGHHETRPNIDHVATDLERGDWAEEDLNDLARCDAIVAFTNQPNGYGRERGGYHVEFGIALGMHKRLIVVGPRVNVFHCLITVEQYDDFLGLLLQLRVEVTA